MTVVPDEHSNQERYSHLERNPSQILMKPPSSIDTEANKMISKESLESIYGEFNGFSDKKNTLIKDEIRNTIDKNIFFVEKKNFKKLIDRNDTKDLLIKKIYPNKLIINFIPAEPICIILFKDDKIILGDNGKKLNIKTTKKNYL